MVLANYIKNLRKATAKAIDSTVLTTEVELPTPATSTPPGTHHLVMQRRLIRAETPERASEMEVDEHTPGREPPFGYKMQRQGSDAGISPLLMNPPGRTPLRRRQRTATLPAQDHGATQEHHVIRTRRSEKRSSIAPRRQSSRKIVAERNITTAPAPLATTVGQSEMRCFNSPLESNSSHEQGSQGQMKEQKIATPLSLATKAGREQNHSTTHQDNPMIPLASLAGRDNLDILASSHLTEIRRQAFIEGDDVGPTPNPLQPEEHYQQQHQP